MPRRRLFLVGRDDRNAALRLRLHVRGRCPRRRPHGPAAWRGSRRRRRRHAHPAGLLRQAAGDGPQPARLRSRLAGERLVEHRPALERSPRTGGGFARRNDRDGRGGVDRPSHRRRTHQPAARAGRRIRVRRAGGGRRGREGRAAPHRALFRKPLRLVLLRLLVGDAGGAVARRADRGGQRGGRRPACAQCELQPRDPPPSHHPDPPGVGLAAGAAFRRWPTTAGSTASSGPPTANTASCASRPTAALRG